MAKDTVLLVCVDGSPTIRVGPYKISDTGVPIRNTAPCVQFAPVGGNNRFGKPMGQLELSEELWQKWFADKELHPQYKDVTTAIQTLLRDPTIFLACPICDFRTKSAAELEKHLNDHRAQLERL